MAGKQGFSDNIKVYVRIRPLIARELSTRECVEVAEREAAITLRDADKQFSCRYDHVFTSQRGQEEVWGELRDVVDNVVEGFNTTLFAYGQTGSGKTHTLFGPESEAFKGPNRGIVPRAIGDVFAKLRGSKAVVCVPRRCGRGSSSPFAARGKTGSAAALLPRFLVAFIVAGQVLLVPSGLQRGAL
jgi:hypothetical protein